MMVSVKVTTNYIISKAEAIFLWKDKTFTCLRDFFDAESSLKHVSLKFSLIVKLILAICYLGHSYLSVDQFWEYEVVTSKKIVSDGNSKVTPDNNLSLLSN